VLQLHLVLAAAAHPGLFHAVGQPTGLACFLRAHQRPGPQCVYGRGWGCTTAVTGAAPSIHGSEGTACQRIMASVHTSSPEHALHPVGHPVRGNADNSSDELRPDALHDID
jgi:hypothetical protein